MSTSVNNEAPHFEFCLYSFWQGLQILNKKWNPSCIVVMVKGKEQIHKFTNFLRLILRSQFARMNINMPL